MASEWKLCRVGEIAAAMGDAPFGSLIKNSDYTESGALVVQGKNIQGRICDWSDRRYVSQEKYESLSRSHCMIGDLLFPKVGTIGKVGLLTPFEGVNEYVLSTNTMRFRADPEVAIADYVYYFFTWSETVNLIHALNSNSVQPVFNFTSLKNFEIPLPPIARQKAIATILGSLDDKIELNRRMNTTLEGMARALFTSWFVDFDPVRAKLDGKHPPGLDQPTATLFPAEFEDSAMGHIPKGWKVCTLGDISRNVSITFEFKENQDVIFVNTGDVLEGDFLHSKRCSHVGLPGQAKKTICPDDILFSEIRPANKRYAYVDFDSKDYVVSTKFMIIRASEQILPQLLYRILILKETLEEFQLQAESRSGTFPQITFDSIRHLPIILPPIDIQNAFQKTVTKFDEQIKTNKKQSRTLAALRDTLLPKLLSGELPV